MSRQPIISNIEARALPGILERDVRQSYPSRYMNETARTHCVVDLDRATIDGSDAALAKWVRKWGANLRGVIDRARS